MSEDWHYELNPRAVRDIERLPVSVRQRIFAGLDQMADDIRACDVVKLRGLAAAFRLRIGDYRILFTIDVDAHVYVIAKVGNRRDVYR